jgi:hypothetical protein
VWPLGRGLHIQRLGISHFGARAILKSPEWMINLTFFRKLGSKLFFRLSLQKLFVSKVRGRRDAFLDAASTPATTAQAVQETDRRWC